MGEHHNNPRAKFQKSLPAQQVGEEFGTGVATQKQLAPNVIVLPEDKVREFEGKLQIFDCAPKRNAEGQFLTTPDGRVLAEDEPSWHLPPDGYKVRRVGDKLTDEDFDAVFVLLSVCRHHSGIVAANGGVKQTMLPIMELARMPWRAFMAAHNPIPPGINGAEGQVKT